MLFHPQSKKSPTGPTERTPDPEYLVALAIYLGDLRGPLVRFHSILDGPKHLPGRLLGVPNTYSPSILRILDV